MLHVSLVCARFRRDGSPLGGYMEGSQIGYLFGWWFSSCWSWRVSLWGAFGLAK